MTPTPPANGRLSTGIPFLDDALGGGLIPGTLTVLVGATGIGKTQFGVKFLDEGRRQEGRRGVVFDMTSRGDSQGHLEYGSRFAEWTPRPLPHSTHWAPENVFSPEEIGDYLRVFNEQGRRVSRHDLDVDQWRDWHTVLAAKLELTIGFFYSHFIRGVRRVVVDGIEPAEKAADSIQLELFEYVYHQILRKDYDWLARDLFRAQFLSQKERVEERAYDQKSIGGLLLWTSHETMLERLVERPLEDGDLLAGANTVICLGKLIQNGKIGRGLYIAKHRGSRCREDILPYTIDDSGPRFE